MTSGVSVSRRVGCLDGCLALLRIFCTVQSNKKRSSSCLGQSCCGECGDIASPPTVDTRQDVEKHRGMGGTFPISGAAARRWPPYAAGPAGATSQRAHNRHVHSLRYVTSIPMPPPPSRDGPRARHPVENAALTNMAKTRGVVARGGSGTAEFHMSVSRAQTHPYGQPACVTTSLECVGGPNPLLTRSASHKVPLTTVQP